jgi:regulator of RNase E activity RraA
MIGINIPIRIGKATVMPGDVVLGGDGGVLFIPPQAAFATFSASSGCARANIRGQIDAAWSAPIEADLPPG